MWACCLFFIGFFSLGLSEDLSGQPLLLRGEVERQDDLLLHHVLREGLGHDGHVLALDEPLEGLVEDVRPPAALLLSGCTRRVEFTSSQVKRTEPEQTGGYRLGKKPAREGNSESVAQACIRHVKIASTSNRAHAAKAMARGGGQGYGKGPPEDGRKFHVV